MDVNNDTHADLIWQNGKTGDVVVWTMNGLAWRRLHLYRHGSAAGLEIVRGH